ncbi:uncharacterized protein SCHCODRAFT_02638244 [Schizophyllum commune H4-8]|uniref:uncharacterized protein n=1 Tax=Schizophyllum commune (strain H4-8 / FGSC 9210) TaxID=578458 RepID=UPI002160C336|nr:uncharacterized protein SCHCODRAFT_02638244 [Schizophyllum commune H4-8]KAI5887484.1 hypothetical protein SCHCODRAFT_02638244 [Schizophyllum commune H4-8]
MQLRIDELEAQKGHLVRAHAELEEQAEKQLKRVLELERRREEPSQAPAAPSVESRPDIAQKLAAAERTRDSLAAQRAHLVETHAAMEGQFENLQKQVLELGQRLEELSQTPAPPAVSSDTGLADKLAATERAKDELAAQKDHLIRAHTALEDQSEKQQKHILELQRRLEELSQASGPPSAADDPGLVQKLKDTEQERDKLQAKHNAMLKHSQRVVAEKQEAEQQKRSLEESNEQLRQRCAELEQWKTNMQRDLHALTHRSGALPARGTSG